MREYYNLRKIIVINGKPRSGKDTFCDIVAKESNYKVLHSSSVVPAKQAAAILGWDGKTKDDIARKFISNLKDLSTNTYDHPFNWIKNLIDTLTNDAIKTNKKFILFIDVREPDEIEKLANYYDDLITLLIRRSSEDNKSPTTHADSDNINKYNYDHILVNDGTLDDLTELAKKFLWDLKLLT